jgi:predicted PurR-regulated permease PerM
MNKLKSWLPGLSFLGITALIFYFHGLFIPFLLALLVAFWLGPKLQKLQVILRNWELTVSLFLVFVVAVFILFSYTGAQLIMRDVARFNEGFTYLAQENKAELDAGSQKIKDWVAAIYSPEELEAEIRVEIDKLQSATASDSSTSFDWDTISESFDKLKGVFAKNNATVDTAFKLPQFSFWYQLGSFLLYLVLILFQFTYFQNLSNRYNHQQVEGQWKQFWLDFDKSFLRYFKLRTRIILWLMPLYIIGFILLDLPGTYIYLIALFILLYIPYLQYLLLIPMAISALVLSAELQLAYWIVMLILLGIFALASLIEELLLIPRIMEAHIGLNSVIMVLGLSFWTYVLGTAGILIGIPLTSLSIIYMKRFLLPLWFPKSS